MDPGSPHSAQVAGGRIVPASHLPALIYKPTGGEVDVRHLHLCHHAVQRTARLAEAFPHGAYAGICNLKKCEFKQTKYKVRL